MWPFLICIFHPFCIIYIAGINIIAIAGSEVDEYWDYDENIVTSSPLSGHNCERRTVLKQQFNLI
jgi:hypothetical protein